MIELVRSDDGSEVLSGSVPLGVVQRLGAGRREVLRSVVIDDPVHLVHEHDFSRALGSTPALDVGIEAGELRFTIPVPALADTAATSDVLGLLRSGTALGVSPRLRGVRETRGPNGVIEVSGRLRELSVTADPAYTGTGAALSRSDDNSEGTRRIMAGA